MAQTIKHSIEDNYGDTLSFQIDGESVLLQIAGQDTNVVFASEDSLADLKEFLEDALCYVAVLLNESDEDSEDTLQKLHDTFAGVAR